MADCCEGGNENSGSVNAGNFLTSGEPVSFSRRTLLHGVSKCILGKFCGPNGILGLICQ